MSDPIAIEPFTIAVDEAVLADLRDRIWRTRWPDLHAGSGWDHGADPGYLRSLLATWAEEFDWRKQERELTVWRTTAPGSTGSGSISCMRVATGPPRCRSC
jgi:Epoxide hydrolase N terminus